MSLSELQLDFDELRIKIEQLEITGGQVEQTPQNMQIIIDEAGGGTTIKWAEITALTDVNNYTVSIWSSRSSYVAGDTASETSKQCRVPTIVDSLAVGDDFGVETSSLTGEDYIAIQQMGAVG